MGSISKKKKIKNAEADEADAYSKDFALSNLSYPTRYLGLGRRSASLIRLLFHTLNFIIILNPSGVVVGIIVVEDVGSLAS